MVQGATQVALTCLDVLGYLDEIQVCTGYEIDGKVTKDFPVPALLERAKPVFTTLPGWKSDIRGITDYDALPANAKAYVDFIEKEIETPIRIVSTGPPRDHFARLTFPPLYPVRESCGSRTVFSACIWRSLRLK